MRESRHCPAVLIAAPSSGQGKTTVTAALARLHRNQGRKVRVFKCGPDFLDPMILERASGAPVYQVDLWMVGADESRRLLWEAAGEADLILIEGVMGLHDGKPSAADIARLLDIPVLCYGLRTDFRGELFIGSQYLLAWSDKLVELKTICFCGRKASMVLRLDQEGRPYNEGEQVVIGGNERYVSVCRKHYKEALSEGSLTRVQSKHRPC